jgi:AraC-like DNA-binding protein
MDKLRKNAKSKNIRDIAGCKADIYNTVCSFLQMMPKGYENYTEISLKYGKIFDLIKNNLSAKLKVSFVSQYANMESSTFSRNFKNDLGISLKSYIDHMLMRKAKEKLLLTGLTIRMIAYELEFSDEFYFSRFFKKHAGIAPTTYRKTNRLETLLHQRFSSN